MTAQTSPASAVQLVLIPGLGCDARMWSDVQARLLPQWPSQVSLAHMLPSTTSIAAIARQLLSDTSGPLVLAGASMGGMVAMEALRQAPSRVQGLILCGTNAQPESDAMRELRASAVEMFEAGDFAVLIRANVALAMHPDGASQTALAQRYVDMVLSAGGAQLARQNRMVSDRPDARQHLPQCTRPVLVLCGDSDQLTPPACSQEIADLLPHAQLHWIARCGHMLTMEQPDAVSQHIQQWLAQQGFTPAAYISSK